MSRPRKRSEGIKSFIIRNVEKHPQGIASLTAKKYGITRQAVHRYLGELIQDGALAAQGTTRNRTYQLKPIADFATALPLAGLEEDKVWRQHLLPLLQDNPPNVLSICQYGFTEIVNNAIEHSEGTGVTISLRYTSALVDIQVKDDGIGIFNKLQKVLGLDNPLHTVLELSKGKLTTDPEHHTGEGIFFASRMFDEFAIRSDKLFFAHFESGGDWLLENREDSIRGTTVRMEISSYSTRTTQRVFSRYTTGDEYGFTKTHVPVSLARYGDEKLVSRSQAKRLLARFERFKEIVLDFKGVDTIDQAFADEIFRVFRKQNPQILLAPVNTSAQVAKMIAWAESGDQ